jgi:hypothetical protein
MTTLRESMLVALQAALTDATDAKDRVYRTRRLPAVQDAWPCIVIVPEREETEAGQRGHYLTHKLGVRVSVYARGDIADQAADALCADIHALIMADETLGGSAMRTGPAATDWRFSDDDQDAVQVDMLYEVVYTTRRASLTERP